MKEIAIIGMGINLPNIRKISEFWELLESGNDLVDIYPKNRQEEAIKYIRYRRSQSFHKFYKDRPSFHNGCFIKDPEMFDFKFFNVTPKQAQTMDPHQRLLLKTMYKAVDDAGYTNDTMRDTKTGVFVGFASNPGNDYISYVNDIDPNLGQIALTGNVPCMLANRFSNFMNLKGPSILVDSACSASLVATHYAIRSIQNGECNMAVVGGVRLCTPVSEDNTKIGIESSNGKTRTFDADADGTGLGEGSGSIVLKSLDEAIADGDSIYAVINGGAVNHDGKKDSLTIPDAQSQANLLQEAWDNTKTDPKDIGFIEVHGTATKVGDPIEVSGLKKAFSKYDIQPKNCAIGTVKTNIGHLFESSGVVGIIKVALMLYHKSIVPNANFKKENPLLQLNKSPFYINKKTKDWDLRNGKRIAGISAFGLGGTNCHLILSDYAEKPSEIKIAPNTSKYLFILSAHTKNAFTKLIKSFKLLFNENCYQDSLSTLCYTQMFGKKHHDIRAAIVFSTFTELKEKVNDLIPIDIKNDNTKVIQENISNCEEEKYLIKFLRNESIESYPAYLNKNYMKIKTPSCEFDESDCRLLLPRYIQLNNPSFEKDGLLTYQTSYIDEPINKVTIPDSDLSYLLLDVESSQKTKEIEKILKATGSKVTCITISDNLNMVGDKRSIRNIEEDFTLLINFICEEGITQIFHITKSGNSVSNSNILNSNINIKLKSLYYLSKALLKAVYECHLSIITENARYIDGISKKETICPENAAVIGFASIIPRETPFVAVKCIDIEKNTPVRSILFEIGSIINNRIAIYRNGKRYVEQFEYCDVVSSRFSNVEIINDNTYLISGGTGDLGLAVAQMLAEKAKCNIILTSRSGLAPRELWDGITKDDKKVFGKIQIIKKIESLGSKVSIYSVDSSNREQLHCLIHDLIRTYGSIDGIFHTAGVPGKSLIVNKMLDDFEEVIKPKIHGTFYLTEMLGSMKTKFLILFSSVASVFPTAGQSDYGAANSYMDAISTKYNEKVHIASIQWCAWKEIGMAVEYNTNQDVTFKAIPTKQGLECLYDILLHELSNVFVGEINYTSPIIHVLQQLGLRMSADIEDKILLRSKNVNKILNNEQQVMKDKLATVCTLKGRADNIYTDMEKALSQAWSDALGYPEIDIHDDFLQLGGESITAISVVTNINDNLGVKIDVATMLEKSTIKNIARYLDEQIAHNINRNDIVEELVYND